MKATTLCMSLVQKAVQASTLHAAPCMYSRLLYPRPVKEQTRSCEWSVLAQSRAPHPGSLGISAARSPSALRCASNSSVFSAASSAAAIA